MTKRKPGSVSRRRADAIAYFERHRPPVRPYTPSTAPATRACSQRREGDEYTCHCGVRWPAADDAPFCPHGGRY